MTKIKTGIIEGFYSIPWTFEERKSLIEFLSEVGMDQFFYAPKDDPYHNVKWREPYTAEKLDELKKLQETATEKNIEFVWAIHPGQNLIKWADYDKEIEKIFKKYDQLHEVGVNSFGLCMDDVDRNQAYEDRKYHLRLVKDLIEHISKYDNKDLIFVNPWYNQAWIDEKGKEYYDMFRNIDNLNIMWTGYDVVTPLRHDANEAFIKLLDKKPYIWFNWPVNDYKRGEIFMEVFEFFDSKDFNYDSIVLNPMNQAELSKLSIYQAAELYKDPENYEPIEAFKRGLDYLDKSVAKELFIISDSFYGSDIYKREENKKYLEEAKINEAFDKADNDEVIRLIDEKVTAIDSYEQNYSNQKLYDEVIPFFESLKYLLLAVKEAINGEDKKARELYDKSKSYTIKIYKEFTQDELIDRQVITSKSLDEIYHKLIEE
ncbi:beta-N-acetylglucosaminidase domain-containing protein [Anaerococcus provencensis]|uniref:beta-N-acetylglucosaminidase domain-containing protein n=1 Tax=Anaerococcus provencensis TaxID=938293 RepID=UPI0002F63A0E|nr:beta-N-acetylglucosaminidase domain-containing protein [Anaerococcus provencensis]